MTISNNQIDSATLQEFLNKNKFIEQSNINQVLIKNIYYPKYNFTEEKNKKLIDNISKIIKDSVFSEKITDKYEALNKYLTINTLNAKLNKLDLQNQTFYSIDKSKNIFYGIKPSNISISYIEGADLFIRRFFKEYMKNISVKKGLYPEDFSIENIKIYTLDSELNTITYEECTNCVPVSINEINLDVLGNVDLPITTITFNCDDYETYKI